MRPPREHIEMTRDDKDPRRDSVSMVGPYARVRVVVAVVVVLVSIVVIAVRSFCG